MTPGLAIASLLALVGASTGCTTQGTHTSPKTAIFLDYEEDRISTSTSWAHPG